MTLTELSSQINAYLHPEACHRDAQVAYVYAGTTMSDLIGHAATDVLLITSLNNPQLARIGELMDVPGLCLTEGAEPCPDLLRLARSADMPILVAPRGSRSHSPGSGSVPGRGAPQPAPGGTEHDLLELQDHGRRLRFSGDRDAETQGAPGPIGSGCRGHEACHDRLLRGRDERGHPRLHGDLVGKSGLGEAGPRDRRRRPRDPQRRACPARGMVHCLGQGPRDGLRRGLGAPQHQAQ